MKRLLLFILLSSLAFNASAQNYQLIKSNEQRIYGSSSSNIGLEVREVDFDGDSIFWLAPHWTKAAQVSACVYADTSSSLGRYVRISENGITTFHTLANETITLLTHANPGDDPWLAYTAPDESWYLKAFVSAKVLENVLGTPDSVKTFNFQAFNADDTPINQWITNHHIRIGKQMGLIKAPHIGIFPEWTSTYGAYSFNQLLGIEGVVGLQNLKWFEVYDFQVDDEIHVEISTFNFGEGYVEHILSKYLSRLDFQDSTVYEVEVTRWYYQGDFQNINLQYQGTEIETHTIRSNPDFDALPATPAIVNDNEFGWESTYGGYYQLGSFEDFPSKYKYGGADMYWPYYDGTPGCFDEVIDWWLCYSEAHTHYVQGLGGPYRNCDNIVGGSHTKLMYFNKSGVEWGSPLSTTASERLSANALKAYPNPATQSFRINLSEEHYPLQLEMYDLSGRLVATATLTASSQEVPVQGLAKGLLMLRGTARNGGMTYGKVVVE